MSLQAATLTKTASPAFTPVPSGLLQRKCAACGTHTPGGGTCANCADGKPGLQRKLSIGASNDPLEAEADRVADQVLARPAAAGATPPLIQRFSSQPSAESAAVPDSVHHTLGRSGAPLDGGVRRDMEGRFGHDFSSVRVHSDASAAQSARDLNAHAYTVGNNIVFGAGRFTPSSGAGQRLLAHELTHVVQQGGAAVSSPAVIRRDLAVEPTVPTPAATALTPAQLGRALAINRVYFRDPAEIEILRDVLGITKTPPTIDDDFARAVASYQASFGLAIDGILGANTASRLEAEITAEADTLGDPPTGTPRRRVARRLHLRSMTSRQAGRPSHQGFVGRDDDNPDGAVTVRLGDTEGGLTNAISLEYTGENSARVNWLQFVNIRMSATPPATPPAVPTLVFNTGTVGTAASGLVPWSDNVTTNWVLDGSPADANPFYDDTGGAHTRSTGRIAMIDQPGSFLTVAQAFAGPGGGANGATTVTFRASFASYAVRADRARYRVNWTSTTVLDITAGTAGNQIYAQGSAGPVSALNAAHRTALLARFSTSAIR